MATLKAASLKYDKGQAPTTAEFARLIAYLRAQGLTLADARAMVGSSVGGRKREAIAALLVAGLKAAKKG